MNELSGPISEGNIVGQAESKIREIRIVSVDSFGKETIMNLTGDNMLIHYDIIPEMMDVSMGIHFTKVPTRFLSVSVNVADVEGFTLTEPI